MPPPPPPSRGEKVNIRINDASAMDIHKAAVTRDYIKQPRLSKNNQMKNSLDLMIYFYSI
jgi:hypothetical protein